LGYFLGLRKGEGFFRRNADFLPFPYWGEFPTYGVAFLSAAALVLCLLILAGTLRALKRREAHRTRSDFDEETHRAIWAAGGWFGFLLPWSRARLHRHYLLVTFPWEFVWFAREALRGLGERWGNRVLGALVVVQFLISASFLQYIVRNGGAVDGDYGVSYRVQEEKGTTWNPPVVVDFHEWPK
jgi:hypothetical protein